MQKSLNAIAILAVLLGGFLVLSVEAKPGRGGVPFNLDECDSLIDARIYLTGGTVRLVWEDIPGVDEWIIVRATTYSMNDAQRVAIIRDSCAWTEDPAVFAAGGSAFYHVLAKWHAGSPENYYVIEDFEGLVTLESYPGGQDVEPDGWQVVTDGAYNPDGASLELIGNTWKRQSIEPESLRADSRWRVSLKLMTLGECHAFGIADSANEMWYTVWGTEIRQSEPWNNTYQGWYPDEEWAAVDFPVGEDWMGRFGYFPAVTTLLYANDNDNSSGAFRIDEIRDVSGAVSLPPLARFRWRITGYPTPDSMDVEFCSMGCDPDGPLYRQHWSFGDGTNALADHPVHRYHVGGRYAVVLTVRDTANRADWTMQIVEDAGGSATREISTIFTGDVMMARRYETDGIIPNLGVNAIFERVQPLISAVELAMCNLECPLTNAETHHPTKMFYFKGRPEYVQALPFAGFDYCALANNHNFDYMLDGMHETMFVLDSVGILHSGSGDNDELARVPAYFTKNGLTAAIVSFCNRDGSWDNEQPFLGAGPGRPGFAMWDRANAEAIIPRVRSEADVVIVQVHSGIEYATEAPLLLELGVDPRDERYRTFEIIPDTSDLALRRYAIDLGADLVVNHHPHVIQGCETYNGRLIAHSMGNFAFDQRFPETFYSVAIQSLLSANGANDFTMHPIYIDRYIPTPATGELAGAILDYMSELSRPMNCWVVRSPFADTALVLTDTSNSQFWQSLHQDTLLLEARGGFAVSAPHRISAEGYAANITVQAPAGAEIRLGRELLWFGNMEPEGATQWDLNSQWEWYDTTQAHRGQRSIGLYRPAAVGDNVITPLIYRFPYNANEPHSVVGWIKGSNASNAVIQFEFWNARTGGNLRNRQTIQTDLTGTFDWTRVWTDLNPPTQSYFFNLRVNLNWSPLMSGWAWYDDIDVVRWETWQSGPITVPFPNDISHIQVRAPEGTATAVVEYANRWVSVPTTSRRVSR